jgi:hypothetical protein
VRNFADVGSMVIAGARVFGPAGVQAAIRKIRRKIRAVLMREL